MKFIIINRNRLGITIILLGLMLVLFGLGKNFDNRLKEASLIYYDINSVIKHEGLGNSFSYSLPKQWTVKEEKFSGNEVTYSSSFSSQDKIINGFVQVWNYEGDVKLFLEKSKESAFKPKASQYKEYNLSEKKINDKTVYQLKYTVNTGEGKYYRGYEYFVPNTGKFYRFSFFVKEDEYKEVMPELFETIVKTLSY